MIHKAEKRLGNNKSSKRTFPQIELWKTHFRKVEPHFKNKGCSESSFLSSTKLFWNSLSFQNGGRLKRSKLDISKTARSIFKNEMSKYRKNVTLIVLLHNFTPLYCYYWRYKINSKPQSAETWPRPIIFLLCKMSFIRFRFPKLATNFSQLPIQSISWHLTFVRFHLQQTSIISKA